MNKESKFNSEAELLASLDEKTREQVLEIAKTMKGAKTITNKKLRNSQKKTVRVNKRKMAKASRKKNR